MKKFVLNSLNILAWIFELLFGVTSLVLLAFMIMFAIPEVRNTVLNIKQVTGNININVNDNVGLIVILFICAIVMFAALCWSVRSFRLVIRNINKEIYFDQRNLNLLHSTLISLSIFAVANILEACVQGVASYNLKMSLKFDLSGVLYGLLLLGFVYVIYLVFKNGLKLQEEDNKFI